MSEEAEKWRTIKEFPDFVISSKGRFAWKSAPYAGKLKQVLERERKTTGSRFFVELSKVFDGKRKHFRVSAKITFKRTWPEKENPWG